MAIVRYLVRDVDRATLFYTEKLGFELEVRRGSAFAVVVKGDQELWLSGPQSSAAQAMPDGRVPEPGGWNRIVIEVLDLATLITTLKAAGALFRCDVVTGPGGSQALVEDGEGNVVELFQPRG